MADDAPDGGDSLEAWKAAALHWHALATRYGSQLERMRRSEKFRLARQRRAERLAKWRSWWEGA